MGVKKSKIPVGLGLPFEQSESDIFIPHKKYRPFPVKLRSQPRTICTKFRPKPPKKERRSQYQETRDVLWFVDCEFIPCSDDELTSCGIVNQYSWIPKPMTRQGFICKWHLGKTTAYRTYSEKSRHPQPRIHPHPNGKYVCFISDYSEICVLDLESGAFNKRESELDGYYGLGPCAVSPNGAYLVFLRVERVQFELMVVEKRSLPFQVVGRMRCRDINRGLGHKRACDKQVECKWSPDSQFIAIAISTGYLSVVDCRNKECLEPYYNVIDDFDKFGHVRNVRAFDFDPKSAHSILAFATRGDVRKLHVCDLDEKAIVRSTELTADDEDDIELIQFRLNVFLRYSHSGDLIAVALGVRIQILTASDLRVIYILDGLEQDNGGYVRLRWSGKYPSVLQFSFSRFDEYLAVSSMDGFIRVWQLDADLNLQNLCRKVILASTCCDQVKFLPIPDRLKLYLLQIPDWAAARGAEAYL
ncbi:uncharacterized protein LOC141902476 isoform X2 [Tubulanus polymorphus]|uniref:uncharacterized protein LOC141902476 isoform X2 n=1 Tax=Tubulanus polymorphus TaxID=672921 RepID=UPI003DA5F628